MRILLIKMSSMGDILHTLPAITDAAHQVKDLTIDWVVEENFKEIPHWHTAVQHTFPIALRRWRKQWFNPFYHWERKQFLQHLNRQHYDKIIDAQGLIKSALVMRNAHGEKHGYHWQSAREPLASLFYNHRYQIARQQHAVERIRQLFAQSLGYILPNQQGDYAIANHFLTTLPTDHDRYLIFLHATTREDKHWPEAQWRQLITLTANTGLRIKLPWGTLHEHQRALRLAQGFSHVEVLPKLTLAQIATLMAGARAIVSVDTGLSHLAAALGKTNITLYGPTDPGLIGGYGENQYPLISTTNLMADLSAEQVYHSLASLCLN